MLQEEHNRLLVRHNKLLQESQEKETSLRKRYITIHEVNLEFCVVIIYK